MGLASRGLAQRRLDYGVHFNRNLNLKLRQICQQKYEETHTREGIHDTNWEELSMTSGQDLIIELQGRVSMLDTALKQLGNRGRAAADAEQKYRISLAQKIMVERDKGTPATIMSDICRGDPQIAKLKFDRDVAEVTYKSAMEACNIYKIQVKVLENQIDREYRG